MYNAISNWVKSNLIDTFSSKTELDREFNNELKAEYKNYNNLITVCSNAAPEEDLVVMDTEIAGKQIKILHAVDSKDKRDVDSTLNVTTEKGDVLRPVSAGEPDSVLGPIYDRKHPAPKKQLKTDFTYQRPLSSEYRKEHEEQIETLRRELRQETDNTEVLDEFIPFRSIGKTSSLTNLHILMEQCPPPQPSLTYKQLKALQLNDEQAFIMTEQVRKMKTGMERLHDVIRKFRTDKFKQDIDFIIANVGPTVEKSERLRQLETTNRNRQRLI